ncbi:rhamnogalacturonan acetylesterase [Aspergillus saccharolyticus JOP 1030-1]|uniref:Esterase n=1 Tax=Aspergillus saccharolyticus JOP 1030-1 TaxID=1450539 RepID=A0A319AFP7_9EURO|nr:esterase [Aspergillus saccharolyticus JOP 1030-1]PYH45602.1 esterase [Aspergillus saccharolyticus JOP 1030-1]
MKPTTVCSFLLALVLATTSTIAQPTKSTGSNPPLFLLAGDSTTATQSSNGGGWGDGFLNTTLHHGASGINYGVNGRTTVSYRAGGYWATVLASVAASLETSTTPYVTIQFGHNDQKASANISIVEYTTNLEQFVADVRTAGGTPILVTPLSRRGYENSTGTPKVVEDLADQRAATIAAAEATGSTWIDLNEASTQYLNAIGEADAWTYNLNPTDETHLNVEGSVVFGGLVALLIEGALSELKAEGYVRVKKELEKALEEGKYYWP